MSWLDNPQLSISVRTLVYLHAVYQCFWCAGVAHDMLDFLQEFMAAHPELADNDFYVTGESYAGHYVPAVAHRVWQYNKGGMGQHIPLKGFAIGTPPC